MCLITIHYHYQNTIETYLYGLTSCIEILSHVYYNKMGSLCLIIRLSSRPHRSDSGVVGVVYFCSLYVTAAAPVIALINTKEVSRYMYYSC